MEGAPTEVQSVFENFEELSQGVHLVVHRYYLVGSRLVQFESVSFWRAGIGMALQLAPAGRGGRLFRQCFLNMIAWLAPVFVS